MEASLENILAAQPVLEALAKEKLPARAAFRLTKILRAVDQVLRDFEAVKQNVFTRYGEQVPDSNPPLLRIKAENEQAFRDEWAALLGTNETLDVQPLKLDDLGNIEFTAEEMLALAFLLEE